MKSKITISVFSYILTLALFAASVCYPVQFGLSEDIFAETDAFFNREESPSGMVDVPGFGTYRYYAQNDSLWRSLTYESNKSDRIRSFGDGGCNPTSVAMAIRNLTGPEKLMEVISSMDVDYSFCPCSITKQKCGVRHARYYMTSIRDYERFLPLIVGAYAAGINETGSVARGTGTGTGTSYIRELAACFDIDIEFTTDLKTAVEATQNGSMVVTLTARGSAFTSVGHYMLLVGKQEDRYYILDPLARDHYSNNHGRIVNIIKPGLVYVLEQDMKYADLVNFIIFSKKH